MQEGTKKPGGTRAAFLGSRRSVLAAALVLALAAGCGGDRGGSSDTLDSRVDNALAFAETQLAAAVSEIGDATEFPQSAPDGGAWETTNASAWTSGFFPGCLWLVHERTGRADFLTWAEEWTANLEGQKTVTSSHDVGFQVFCSFGQGHRIAGVAGYEDVVLTAAASLDTRYSSTVGCIKSWDWEPMWPFPVIIDNMMNLEILFWAAAKGGSSDLYDHALSHALKTSDNHVRTDDTTYHVVDYDPFTGNVTWRGHHQGCDDESTWARGMAWGIYGFTMAYRETDDAALLATAERLADWFINNLPPDHVPYWDFEAPDIPDEPRDTSAAAIAASGFLELETLTGDPAKQAKFHDAARDILYSLCSSEYLAQGTGGSALLRHGYYHGPKSVIFGDYYFLEALVRYCAAAGR